jgi:hypothetical protein
VKWLVVGLSAGVLHSLVLRRKVLYAGWWMLASTVGWTMGGLAMQFVSGEFSFGMQFVVGGLLAGGVTGAFFVVAARRPSLTQLPPPEPPRDSWAPPTVEEITRVVRGKTEKAKGQEWIPDNYQSRTNGCS